MGKNVMHSRQVILGHVQTGPMKFEEIESKPGVYKLNDSDSSPAVAITTNGRPFYVAFGKVKPLGEAIPNPAARRYYGTDIDPLDEIIP